MPAKDTTLLGQRQRTLLLPARAAAEVSAFPYTSEELAFPFPHGGGEWGGHTCKSSGLCYQRGSLSIGHLAVFCWMVKAGKACSCPAGRQHAIEGHQPLGPKVTTACQSCWLNKGPWKDNPEHRQSVSLLIKHAEMRATHGELSTNASKRSQLVQRRIKKIHVYRQSEMRKSLYN